MSSQPWLMLYSPADRSTHPYPSQADQYRKQYPNVAWMFDPWTGENRSAAEIGSDVFGKSITLTSERIPLDRLTQAPVVAEDRSTPEQQEQIDSKLDKLLQDFTKMIILTKNFTQEEPKESLFKEVWKVDIIESERGWGQKIEDNKTFDSKDEADKFVKEYNSKNTEASAPDWYMYATTPKKDFRKV